MATIRELARQCGVSVATVSRVFNNPEVVNPDTRQNVLRVAARIGYLPNESARTLATKKSYMIGLVWDTHHRRPGWRHPFLQEILIGLKTALSERGYHLLMLATSDGEGSHDRAVRRHNLDGVVFIDNGTQDPALLRLAESGVPCVSLDRPVTGPRATHVISDNAGGARTAVEHLYERGRRAIATIAGPGRTVPGAERLAGYRAALAGLGLPARDGLVVEGDFYLSGGYAAMRRLLEADERPDAVFAAGDEMAIGAMRAIAEAGLKVPEDIAVVGFDDIELAALVQPGLTTVAQDKAGFGTAAAATLVAMIDGTAAVPPPPSVLPTALIVRGTT
ncbi:LacI family DNA-binding transcriptional regulator [Planomonospora sp. ID91781]|uniref:LacI family transcriptional regulator n=1 Tax=Planomonospora sphaerica TaxID=161355 RepID=A0A161LII2_9ACTN|nr:MULTISPECIES: LacI family DNA-binding transcriptional regulator [Planomonospora]MBG0824337.1 LacI family DNA-binding transcriptional regulator [Planomonospora sp. ID91781]GAT66005.1 lacI family transcriptional regulator [Planomonospora sphaerica]